MSLMSLSAKRMLFKMVPGTYYRDVVLWEMSESDNPREIVQQARARELIRRYGFGWKLTDKGVQVASALRDDPPPPRGPKPPPPVKPVLPKREHKPPLTPLDRIRRGDHPRKYLTRPQIQALRKLSMGSNQTIDPRTIRTLVVYGMLIESNNGPVCTPFGLDTVIRLRWED